MLYSPQTKCPSKKKRLLHSVSTQNVDMPPTMHDKCWRGTKSTGREECVCSGEAEGAHPAMFKLSSKFSQRYCLFGWEFGSVCISVVEDRKTGGSLFFFPKQHLSLSQAYSPTSNKRRQTTSHKAPQCLSLIEWRQFHAEKNEHQSLPQLHQHYL